MNQYKIHQIYRLICRYAGVLLVILFSQSLIAKDAYVINSGAHVPFMQQDGKGFYNLLVTELFSRIGKKITVVHLASERSLIFANDGTDDGNLARIKGLEKKFKNLIRVPEKVIHYEFTAFSKNIDMTVTGWESLKPYNIGIIRGWKLLERKLSGGKGIVKAKTPRQLFELLDKGRVDIVIFEKWGGLWQKKNQNIDVKTLLPAVAEKDLYLYLHKSNKDIINQLSQALVEMKEDGYYGKLSNKILTVLEK